MVPAENGMSNDRKLHSNTPINRIFVPNPSRNGGMRLPGFAGSEPSPAETSAA